MLPACTLWQWAGHAVDRGASLLHLSKSRFLRQFTAHTGTSLRRHRLWARLLWVGRAVAKGASRLTTATMNGGFASPSHFSDTFRELYGLTATALLDAGIGFVVFDG